MDERKCVYCNVAGDDEAQDAGRLLYFNIDEWAHVNCVLWSAEVYEDNEGRLQNAHVALTRGRQMVRSCYGTSVIMMGFYERRD